MKEDIRDLIARIISENRAVDYWVTVDSDYELADEIIAALLESDMLKPY